MRIAFIVERYGTEILGGPEYACRLTAEQLAERHDVDVLTTCASDNVSWKNDYAEGADRVRGVTVRRFANSQTRDIADFTRYSDWIFQNPHDPADEMEWLKRQGPWSPGLHRISEAASQAVRSADLLHVPATRRRCWGCRSIRREAFSSRPPTTNRRSISASYRDVFRLPKAIGYLSEPERRFVARRSIAARRSKRPSDAASKFLRTTHIPKPGPGRSRCSDAEPAQSEADEGAAGDSGRFPSHVSSRGAGFERRHRIHGRSRSTAAASIREKGVRS